MVITALKQQIRNPERVNIFVDGKYSFSLTLGQIVAEKLKVGLVLNDELLEDLRIKSTNEKLRIKAMNWAMMRPRSVRELKDYLRRITYKKNHDSPNGSVSPEVQHQNNDEIITEFIERGWVSDTVFASWWVGRSSRSSKSTSFLRSELISKGVDRSIIVDVLSERDEGQQLQELIVKLQAKPRYQDQQKLMRHLMGKGFSYSSVREALKLGAEDNLD